MNIWYGSTATSLGKEISASAKRAVYIFLASIAVIVLFASCQRLLPSYEDGSRLKMNIVIQIVMLTAAALMVIVSKASPKKAVAVSVLINSQGAVVVAMLPLAYSLGIRDLCFWVYCQASMAISSYRTILRTSLRSTSTAAERP